MNVSTDRVLHKYYYIRCYIALFIVKTRQRIALIPIFLHNEGRIRRLATLAFQVSRRLIVACFLAYRIINLLRMFFFRQKVTLMLMDQGSGGTLGTKHLVSVLLCLQLLSGNIFVLKGVQLPYHYFL